MSLIAVTLPITALLCLVVMLTSLIVLGSPIFFVQTRPGRELKRFRLVKFRTMSNQRDASGVLLPDADRLGRYGRFLRSISLDELPAIWNVIKGEMSLVGPRPLLEEYTQRYTPRQNRRHDVLPGITGWAQINGRNSLSWEEKFELDLWYVENKTLFLDIKIIFKTFKKVFLREGISAQGEATMPEFLGNANDTRLGGDD